MAGQSSGNSYLFIFSGPFPFDSSIPNEHFNHFLDSIFVLGSPEDGYGDKSIGKNEGIVPPLNGGWYSTTEWCGRTDESGIRMVWVSTFGRRASQSRVRISLMLDLLLDPKPSLVDLY